LEHSFDVELAVKYGLVEAILLNNFQYWIDKNKANRKNYYDGSYWTYNTTKAFSELFPYVSQRKIQNALKNLRENNIIKVGNYNENQYDRTLWYAFTKKGECIMQKKEMESAKKGNGFDDSGKCINTNINTNNKTDVKHIYGKYKNVKLTDEEYQKLVADKLDYMIDVLSEGKARKGYTYKSDYLAVRSWAKREKPKSEKKDKLKSEPNFDIEELKQKAILNDDFDI
jgi:hypothetical protein